MKALFLDIDGVLQPKSNHNRFEHIKEMNEIVERLNVSHPAEKDWKEYAKYDGHYDIAAVMFDWDKAAVELIRDILESTNAKIVLSSDWKEKGESMMKALFSLHGLDKYFYDTTYYVKEDCVYYVDTDNERKWRIAETKKKEFRTIKANLYTKLEEIYPKIDIPSKWFPTYVDGRTVRIREYLDRHPEITSYATIDDRNIEYGLDGHGVTTKNSVIDEDAAAKCKEILAIEDGPYPLPTNCKTKELQEWRDKWVN